MPKLRQVALLIETSRAYGRSLLRGVSRYNREQGRWSVYFRPHGLGDPPPPWLRRWKGDGILARIGDRRVADAVLDAGVAVVELRGVLSDLPVPFIGVDNQMVAQLAFDHLRDRGFRHFAFCSMPRGDYPIMDERCDNFRALVQSQGFFFSQFKHPAGHRRLSWQQEQSQIARWIAKLPKPVGVAACNDDYGLQVLDACRRAEVLVPDEVAVIAVDNDDYLCGLAIPPLTSIDVIPERIGYEAAALLDRMMDGESVSLDPILMPPRGVVTRQSTDVLATDDEAVARAVHYIRQHACDRIGVADVVRQVRLSRTALEPRVKAVVGRSIYQEIQRVQIEQVRELLAETELPIKQVAVRCGFSYVQYMTRAFREATGQTPAQYRKNVTK